jgi:dihydrofolate reductase
MKASVFIATSLDGFIARADGGLDWLPGDDVEDHGYDALMATVDAIVMGRNTYEIVLGFGTWPYGGKSVVVLTTRPLIQPRGGTVDVMAGTPNDIVARLAERGVQHIYVDGGITVQRFLAAGLIQRFTITRIPVLLGRGIPLFGPIPADIWLEHLATKSYKNGMVTSEYVIRGTKRDALPRSDEITPAA